MVGGIETIDYLRAKSNLMEFKGFLRLSAMAYVDRAPFKGDEVRDYKKAIWYLQRLVKEIEGE